MSDMPDELNAASNTPDSDKTVFYDPKQGKSFDVEVRRRGEDRLKVTGYLGIKLLSESFVWSRAPENIQLCELPN